MAFLRSRDYLPQIQTNILSQLTKGDTLVQTDAEENAQEEISSYLRQRFDLTVAFADTVVYDPAAAYNAGQLVELNYPAWILQNYNLGDLVSFTDGNAYVCTQTTSGNEDPTNGHFWTLLGVNFGLYYIPYPYQLFDVNNGNYMIGEFIYYKNNIYKCLTPSYGFDHSSLIQFESQQNVPLLNIFPDDPVNGVIAWGNGTPYSVTGLQPLQDTSNTQNWNGGPYDNGAIVSYNGKLWQAITKNNIATPGADIINWEPVSYKRGDNRDRSLVKNMVDIALYTLHANIAPQNIPALRQRRYERAIDWCKSVAGGNITPNLQMLQPAQGGRIRMGGNIKLDNTW